MATTRVILDTKGKNLMQLLTENLAALGDINMSLAAANQIGSYDSARGDVKINYPRIQQATNFNKPVEPQHEYFVREVEFPPQSEGAPIGKGDFLEERAHDTIGGTPEGEAAVRLSSNDNALPGQTRMDKFTGKTTSLVKIIGADDNFSGKYKTEPQNFMRLKGRKSLFTLLQETWNVFFNDSDGDPIYRNTHPVEGNTQTAGQAQITNKFKSSLDYMANYYNEQGGSFVDPPDTLDIYNQSYEGIILGQILGGVGGDDLESTISSVAQNETRNFFQGLANTENDLGLSTFYDLMAQNAVTRVSQLYVAGWGRPQENYLTKKPLQENLQQNLLLPPNSSDSVSFGFMPNPLNMPGNTTGNGEGTPGYGKTENTFTSLYTRNRAGAAGGINATNPIFNNGVIAGTPINLLQEPNINRSVNLIQNPEAATPANEDTVPFSFEKDDAQYLTYEKRSAGFTTNGMATNVTPSAIEPAVKDYPATSVDPNVTRDNGKEVVAAGNGQHFPFTFSTVNRTDGRLQICFLQAIINTLSESYTPTWASKHFFGRSEQTHTYTFTDRTIDISFTVFANEMRQLQNVYERVLWLAQQCYPEFDNTGRMATGPIVALRVGDLFQYKTGVIRSLSYDWLGFGGGKWEMTSAARMPQGCVITLNYQIIHDSMPTRDTNFYHGPGGGLDAGTTRYRTITSPNGGNSFDAFTETETSEIGYGTPFLDSGQLGEASDGQSEHDYLLSVRTKNRIIEDEGAGGLREVNRVPVGRDEDSDALVYAS